MQWIDILVLVLLAAAVIKAFMYYRNPKNSGGCHGGCSGCTQQCNYRISKTPDKIQKKNN